MKKLNLVFLFVIVLLFFQCKKDQEIYNVEQIVSVCDDNQITDSLNIINHLIGTWDLIEFNGNFGTDGKPPFIKMVLKEDGSGIISIDHYQRENIIYNEFNWYLDPDNNFGNINYFKLRSDPYINHVRANYFCDQFLVFKPFANSSEVRYVYVKNE